MPPSDAAALDRVAAVIDGWAALAEAENPVVASVERPEPGQWFLRLTGEEKQSFSVLLTLGQRTLRYESYLLPAPEENREETYAQLLRRNLDLYGLAVALGEEDGVFLVGRLDVRHVTDEELDRVLGSLYEATERFFRPALRLAFASRFGD